MRCKNCELEHTLNNEEGCLIISSDDITENRNGEYGCRFNRTKIKKEIKYYYEVIEPDIVKQMGDFANFVKQMEKENKQAADPKGGIMIRGDFL